MEVDKNPEIKLEPLTQGEIWLDVLGYSELGDCSISYTDKQTKQPAQVLAKNFDTICGDHALPIFTLLEVTDQSDPMYQSYLGMAQKVFRSWLPDKFDDQGNIIKAKPLLYLVSDERK